MVVQPIKQPVCTSVSVEAPARLHLGFIDLNGGLGRRFGSLGVTLDTLSTQLTLAPARTLKVTGPRHAVARTLAVAASLSETLGLPSGVDIAIPRAIPDHAGLGSGTQLALAVAGGLARLYGLELDSRELATLTGRGRRSGIGIGAFDGGGFLLDGGRGESAQPPPLLLRRDFPTAWRFLLVFDRAANGIHGQRESSAFRALAPFPAAGAAALCRLVLMQALPALAEADFAGFSAAIGELQQVVGDYFAPAQSGRFASPAVAAALDWLRAQGVTGIGQSSWGPTGFALLPDEDRAQALSAALQRRFAERPNLHFETVGARNHGGRITLATTANRSVAGARQNVHPRTYA